MIRIYASLTFVKPSTASPLYEGGHIVGAQHAPYSNGAGQGQSRQAADEEALTALIQSLGIDRTTPVVVVYEGRDSTDFGSAARVYWTLKAAGVPKLSILNGGMKAWRAAGLPLIDRRCGRRHRRSSGHARPDADRHAGRSRAGGRQWFGAIARRAARAHFLPARRAMRRRKTPGTIVGAKNVSHDVWFTSDAQLLPSADIKRVARRSGMQTDQPTISFCNTGHWAATNWFVLSELLGQSDVKLYPGIDRRRGPTPAWRWTTYRAGCSSSGCS